MDGDLPVHGDGSVHAVVEFGEELTPLDGTLPVVTLANYQPPTTNYQL